MSVIVKVLTKGSKTAVYTEDGEQKRFTFEAGRNKVSDDLWKKVKNTDFIKNKLRKDEMTISMHVEAEEEILETKIVDWEKAEAFIGQDDGKDLMAEYALEFGIKLRKNLNISNMLEEFKEKAEV